MPLNGYSPRCGKLSGGVKGIAIAPATGITTIEYGRQGEVTNMTVAEGSGFAEYVFREDAAEYLEKVSCDTGTAIVEHRLTLFLERMDGNSGRAVRELLSGCRDGYAAIITLSNGVRYLVGADARFDPERPLRIESAAGKSGEKLSDDSGETLTLACTDSCKAPVFTGDIPYAR